MRRERIAMVYPWANLDSVPCLCRTIERLADAGFDVDVFTRFDAAHVPPRFRTRGVRLFAPWNRDRRPGFAKRWSDETYATWLLTRRHLTRRYRCVIGVDPAGLNHADVMNQWVRTSLVYYSLELLLSDEIRSPGHHWLKRRELEASRRASLVIIQDEHRGRLLTTDNHLQAERFAYVPNAPSGPARRRRHDRWHRQFNLAGDARVALHAGSIDAWTGIEDIVRSVQHWPAKWVLVIHTREAAENSPVIQRLRQLAPSGRVHFSLTPVPRDEYDELIDAADAGIVMYVPVEGSAYAQENVRTIGLSSGKVAYYLRAGLPVVVNDASSLGAFVREHRCGEVVQRAADLREAVERLDAHEAVYSANALTTFRERLDFDQSIAPVIERIRKLKPDAQHREAPWWKLKSWMTSLVRPRPVGTTRPAVH